MGETSSRTKTAEFSLTKEDIRKGGNITSNVRRRIKAMGSGTDQVGHLVARMFNGSGSDVDNFVPMAGHLNNGAFKSLEREIRDYLENIKDSEYENVSSVKVKLFLYYREDDHPERPYQIGFEYTVFYENGQPSNTGNGGVFQNYPGPKRNFL
jgi:DNA/RNA non-specific endonuclease